MFGYNIINPRNYHLIGCYKYGVIYTGSYTKIGDCEKITSMITGENYYSITDYINSIYGLRMENELFTFLIYNEITNAWLPLYAVIRT